MTNYTKQDIEAAARFVGITTEWPSPEHKFPIRQLDFGLWETWHPWLEGEKSKAQCFDLWCKLEEWDCSPSPFKCLPIEPLEDLDAAKSSGNPDAIQQAVFKLAVAIGLEKEKAK